MKWIARDLAGIDASLVPNRNRHFASGMLDAGCFEMPLPGAALVASLK